ncbi:hypothetical protein [Clostridium sp. HBUAS56017]|jgi:hypothetical protein|nr:hypothetical protein [Clostridium sp. HBUAS56017]
MQVINVSNYFRPVQNLTEQALLNLRTQLNKKAKYKKRVENSKKLRRK